MSLFCFSLTYILFQQFFSNLIMPAFCSLFLPSYLSENYSGKISTSLTIILFILSWHNMLTMLIIMKTLLFEEDLHMILHIATLPQPRNLLIFEYQLISKYECIILLVHLLFLPEFPIIFIHRSYFISAPSPTIPVLLFNLFIVSDYSDVHNLFTSYRSLGKIRR